MTHCAGILQTLIDRLNLHQL